MDDRSTELLNALRLRFLPGFSDDDFNRYPETTIILLRNLPPEIAHTYLDIIRRVVRDQPPFQMPKGIPIKWAIPAGVGLKFRVPVEVERIRQAFIDAQENSADISDIVRPTPWLTTPFAHGQTTEEARKTYFPLRQQFPSGVILGLAKSLKLNEQRPKGYIGPKGYVGYTGLFQFGTRIY
jgi:hypothetical protein